MTPAHSAQLLDTPEQVRAFPLAGTHLIEASAGTGKTYTIANLYLRQVLSGVAVDQLLVVTFTEAATDELRGRIRARLVGALRLLDQAAAGDPSETRDAFLADLLAWLLTQGPEVLTQTRQRLRLAVRSMDEAAIYTIHGFCQRALTEFAFHSGQQFQLEILTDDHDLWRTALQDWWRRTGYPLDQGRARLFQDALGGLDTFRGLIAPLLGHQAHHLLPEVQNLTTVFARVDAAGPVIARLAQGWRTQGQDLCSLLQTSKGLSRDKKGPYHPDPLTIALAQLDAWFAAWEATQEFSPPPDGFYALTAQSVAERTLKRSPDPRLDDPYFAACGALWDLLLTLKRDLKVAALVDAAAFARTEVHKAKERAQALSFDDLLTRLHDALQAGDKADAEEGPSEALARSVRARFPVAMIDEFQDTDPVQYGIFQRLYLDRPELTLIMIGDPKQAIYSFRGGDIFAYGRAKSDVGPANLYSLGTNWRSTPAAIRAVNTLFERRGDEAFVFGAAIPFVPVTAAERTHQPLYRGSDAQPALTLWTLPCERDTKGAEKALPKEKVRTLTQAALAQEIASLIIEGRTGRAHLAAGPQPHPSDRPLRPRDIAVLVRSRFEGAEVRKALAAWGINAVSVERTPVFATEEAAALEPLLQAVVEPGDRTLARIALASPLLGLDYARIEADIQGETAWAAWLDTLLALREDWQRRGFMAMFQSLLQRLGSTGGPGSGADGLTERRLTNLLHLGELLQEASKTQAGMDALLSWYAARRAEAAGGEDAGDAQQLRLESDAELVQIVTVHGAKGLEYPVVFLPDLWSCRPRDAKGLVTFHRGTELTLDAGSDERDAHLLLAERERLAEDLRLVYVALTRARAALYLVWGRAGSQSGHAGESALGWLLHPHQSAADLEAGPPDAFTGVPDLQPDLDALAAASGGTIRVLPIPQPNEVVPVPAEADPPALAARRPTRPVPHDWHIASFSELARNVHPGPTPPRDPAAEDPALRFPAGSDAGSYLHLLLELIDFRAEVGSQVLAHSARIATRFGLDHASYGQDAAIWLERVTHTPLDATGLCLAQLGPQQRLNELEFDFATDRVDIAALNRSLHTLWTTPQAPLDASSLPAPASRDAPPSLDADAFAGLVTGVIDLVFEHDGRYYIADYKSNYLGPNPEDYTPERLAAAVRAHRYDLQYLLYTLALHRYLRSRLPGYDYDRHFGGACYLFLRGMRPERGHTLGIHWARPDLALVQTLDREVFRQTQAQGR